MKLTETELCSYCGYLLPNHEDKCKLMTKLTEERIAKTIHEEVDGDEMGLRGVDKAASAIYSAHEQEIDELQKAYSDALDECISRNIEGHRQMVRLREENAQLKQSQKNFAMWYKKVLFIKSEWAKVKDMDWNQLYEYWKTLNKNV